MGIDYGAKIIVGCTFKETNLGEKIDKLNEVEYNKKEKNLDYELIDEWEYIEDLGLDCASPYYDAPLEDHVIGFSVDDINIDEVNEKWLKNIKNLANKFEEITGTPAMLIGALDIF